MVRQRIQCRQTDMDATDSVGDESSTWLASVDLGVDLMLQMLYLGLTLLCIFYLIVITIDWYDGVIRFSETFFRQIAIDGAAPD